MLITDAWTEKVSAAVLPLNHVLVDKLRHDGDGHGCRRGGQDVFDLRVLEISTQAEAHVKALCNQCKTNTLASQFHSVVYVFQETRKQTNKKWSEIQHNCSTKPEGSNTNTGVAEKLGFVVSRLPNNYQVYKCNRKLCLYALSFSDL